MRVCAEGSLGGPGPRFDGDVVAVKMKALAGQYHVLNSSGVANETLTQTTSLEYVQGNFGAGGPFRDL